MGIDAIREAAVVLTEYAVNARYPNQLGIDYDEATVAVQYAEQMQTWAASQLNS